MEKYLPFAEQIKKKSIDGARNLPGARDFSKTEWVNKWELEDTSA